MYIHMYVYAPCTIYGAVLSMHNFLEVHLYRNSSIVANFFPLPTPYNYYTVKECNGTEVRLRDGTSEYDGSVEVCSEGVWVTVCDDDTWDLYDATVVCSQLGYSSGREFCSVCIMCSFNRHSI